MSIRFLCRGFAEDNLITHFIGEDEVKALATDLGARLKKLEGNYPLTWFALGKSGENFVDVLVDFVPPSLAGKLRIIRASANRDTGEVVFRDDVEGQAGTAMLIDSAVHSGQSMLAAIKKIQTFSFSEIITYSLVLKRNSSLIPNYFGVLIDETDRCLFQLDAIPNNRLCERTPFGILRKLGPDDAAAPRLETGEGSVDTDWTSLLYEQAKGAQVFVCEHAGKIVGALSFSEKARSILVDLVANSTDYRRKGIGAALMRWAETWARSKKMDAVELWAIQNQVSFYQKLDFESVGRQLDLGGTSYHLMRRKLLYNLSFVDQLATR